MLKRGALGPEWARVALASIGDAVITTDTEGRVTFLNPVAASLTGWPQEEAVGRALDGVFRVINEASREPVESPAARALRDGVVVGLANHSLLISKDGTERPIDDSAAPIKNDEGEIVGVVLVFRDISDRRRQETLVQDALAYAESIVATLREPFLVLDESLRVRTANDAFYRTFRVAKEETEGRLIYELGERQWDIPSLRKLLEEVLPQNHSFQDYDVEHDFPTIGRRFMRLNARRLASVDSRPDLILLAIEDITERTHAENAVMTSEVRYRRLFESAKDGILILDVDTGKIVDSNPFMSELLGLSEEDFVGKELWEIGLFSDKAANQDAYRELQEREYVRYDHLPLETRDGRRAEVEFVSNVYQVDSRRVAQCNIRDVSERARLQRKMEEQTEELSDLHRRKDEFLAMLSHELRGPLAPISNAVQMLRLHQADETLMQKQARSMIERQVATLKHLVDDLLEISRITTGRIRLNLERIGLAGIVESAVESVQSLVEQRKQEVTLSLPPEPIWLYADAGRLEQVLTNLLTNAAKYSNERGQIQVSAKQDGDEVVLSVRDGGIGIAPELLPHVFDLFTQAERSLDRAQGGLGIGLTLVQRLVEMHGGTVQAHSVLGRGSEFVVRLPVTSVLVPTAPSVAAETQHPTDRSLRILIVEDNADAAQSMAALLKVAGHDVRTAYDGSTALKEALDQRPEVVLLDIGLPGMNGLEVAKWMREHPALRGVALIAMTGYGQEIDRRRVHQSGFDHHLLKPTDFARLQEILATVSQRPT